MVAGETGVGKSTWIHAFLNYMQGIQIEENIRYLLFDQKEKQERYELKHGKKESGSSVTDIPEVYNVEPTVLFNNPIRLIDTAGFGDTRGKSYDEKITNDIQKLLEGKSFEDSDCNNINSKIEKLNAICLVFKASDTRAHERAAIILYRLFALFGEDVNLHLQILLLILKL
jgi:predicted GTPase